MKRTAHIETLGHMHVRITTPYKQREFHLRPFMSIDLVELQVLSVGVRSGFMAEAGESDGKFWFEVKVLDPSTWAGQSSLGHVGTWPGVPREGRFSAYVEET